MELAEILVRAGFTREDPVDQHGEFSVRGNVADIFPAGDRLPVRLEFIGDTIESIRQFDPATQRSVAALDRITVAPVRETADTLEGREAERPATFFTYLGRSSRLRLFVSEFDKVREAGDRRFTTLLDSYQDALAREERVLPPARLMLPWPDVMSMLPSATKLETFAADTDLVDAAGESMESMRAQRSPTATCRVSRCRRFMVACRSGWPSCAAPASRARPRCSLPRPPAVPSGSSKSSATTASSPSTSAAPRSRQAAHCSSRQASSRRASGCPLRRCGCLPRPTSSTRSVSATSDVPPRPRRSSPTSAT